MGHKDYKGCWSSIHRDLVDDESRHSTLEVGRALGVEDVRDEMDGLDGLGVPGVPGALDDPGGRVVGGEKYGIRRREAVHIDYTATLDQNDGRCDFRGPVGMESVEADQDMLDVVVNGPGSGPNVVVVVVVVE